MSIENTPDTSQTREIPKVLVDTDPIEVTEQHFTENVENMQEMPLPKKTERSLMEETSTYILYQFVTIKFEEAHSIKSKEQEYLNVF